MKTPHPRGVDFGRQEIPFTNASLLLLRELRKQSELKNNKVSTTILMHNTGYAYAGIFKIMNSLEEQNIVIQTRPGRAKYYTLTPKGIRIVDKFNQLITAWHDDTN